MNEYLLKQAIEQDLTWCLEAPSLLAPHPLLWNPQNLKNEPFQLLNTDLVALGEARQGKLGGYFEALVGYLFKQHPNYHVLAQNEIIYHSKTTLGELDLLVKEHSSGDIIHLELALKFYLWVPNTEQPHCAWIGAGLRDFLANKLARLYQHQLALPKLARQKNCWPAHLPVPNRTALWIPGRLFTPLSQPNTFKTNLAFPNTPWQLNNQVEVSHWVEQEQQPEVTVTLTKGDWLNTTTFTSTQQNAPRLPAQIISPNFSLPLYVLPTQWQTSAQQAISNHIQAQN